VSTGLSMYVDATSEIDAVTVTHIRTELGRWHVAPQTGVRRSSRALVRSPRREVVRDLGVVW